MSKYSYKCGPEATDQCDEYTKWGDNTYSRSHSVLGTGKMTSCYGNNRRYYSDDYTIHEGITELGDYCFSASSVKSVSLPNSLVIIGSSCFRNTKIKRISLPKNLEEIGHNNFPTTLESSITLPAKLKVFPTDNVQNCKNLTEIIVDAENKYFKSIDGILYNHDVTEILICPRGKEGRVIIPQTVRHIAEYCFDGCFKLTSIELPRNIESIGRHAFCGLNLDRLTIPNSVTSIGEACFRKTNIHQRFRFSQRITCLPDYCFQDAFIPNTDFLENIEEIGKNCFESSWPMLPEDLKLKNIKKIGDFAFNKVSNVKVIELPSCIQQIGAGAFSSTADDLKIIFLSMAPFNLGENAFIGMGDNATLYVPSGSKLIFENARPWSYFLQIEEYEPQQDISHDGESIGDDQLKIRLQNIASSFANANRYYLKEILEELALNYQYMSDEDLYQEAIQMIKFNRRFDPVLIPDLEKEICKDWQDKYKLRFVSSCIMNSSSSLLPMSFQGADHLIDEQTKEESPLVIEAGCDINLLTQEIKEDVEVHFSGILRYLQNELSLATKSIKIAVSWFTNYALFKQIKEKAQNGITVQLIINNDSVNNGGYCLNFNELIEAGVHISLVEYPHLIHHKFCVIDDKVVINGSYNWTRFSENNYENIVIFRNNDEICDAFDDEFAIMLRKAEHKDVKAMPDSVPPRPEYDRNAFRQYITEELDAEARLTSDQRDKITALHKASKLNPEYLEKLNPGVKAKYEEEFEVIEHANSIAYEVEEMVKEKKTTSTASSEPIESKKATKSSSAKDKSSAAVDKRQSDQQTKIIQQVKASNLLMALDVSGSMRKTYEAGHVANISKKVVSAALTLTDSQTISLWEFGNNARPVSPVNEIGIENLSDINNVHCTGEGTCLQQFVSTADSAIMDKSLVIIFTDDDGKSIKEALPGMQARKDVFWQIIVYGKHSKITNAIQDSSNISLVCMTNYASKSDAEITQALLKDYINWKSS